MDWVRESAEAPGTAVLIVWQFDFWKESLGTPWSWHYHGSFGRTWCTGPVPLTREPQHCGSIHWTPCMPAKSLQSHPTLRPSGLKPTRLLCLWNFPGKTTDVGCHFLLQGIFPTQGSNPRHLSLLHSLPLATPGKPVGLLGTVKEKVQLKNICVAGSLCCTAEINKTL